MIKYAIGIDGGGTRARLAAIGEDMSILGRVEGGSTNLAAETYDVVYSNIEKLINEFLTASNTNLQNCVSICIGSAGASTGNNTERLTQIFRDIGYTGKLKVMNDAELVLLSETNGDPGAIIISGTGSIAFAIDKEGTTFRTGGWGHMIDDGGSGYRIGMDAIKAALMDFDGRGEETLLTKMVADFFEVAQLNQLTGYVYGSDFSKARVAEIAMLVREAARLGDSVAKKIELNAAEELLSLASILVKRARLDSDKIVLSGSVIVHNENIRQIFESELCKTFPKIQIAEMSESAEVGGAKLAMRYYAASIVS